MLEILSWPAFGRTTESWLVRLGGMRYAKKHCLIGHTTQSWVAWQTPESSSTSSPDLAFRSFPVGFHMVGQRILHNPQLHVNQFPSPDSGGMPGNNTAKPPLWLVVKPALAGLLSHAMQPVPGTGIICSNAACQGYETTMSTKCMILPKAGQCRQCENELLLVATIVTASGAYSLPCSTFLKL